MHPLRVFIASLFLSSTAVSAVAGGPSRLYVDDSASPGGNGQSWASAYDNLQDAMDEAFSLGFAEIWVAEGTYSPDVDIKFPPSSTLFLNAPAEIYGGFGGFETARAERDPEVFETVLTGVLGRGGSGSAETVVTFAFAADNAVLDGFTITGGSNFASSGGGMRIEGDDVVVRNCRFENNSAGRGGGAYVASDSASFDSCVFIDNEAFGKSGGYGGAIFASDSSVEVLSCRFLGNYSGTLGGAISIRASESGRLVVVNSEFSGNYAESFGAAIYTRFTANAITNTTVAQNTGFIDGALHFSSPSALVLQNMVVWGNELQSRDGRGSTFAPQISGSLAGGSIVNAIVQDFATGGVGGTFMTATNVSSADPLFVQPLGPDGVAGSEDDNLRPTVASPTIDTGNGNLDTNPFVGGFQGLPSEDITGFPRNADGDNDGMFFTDLGAHEIAGAEQLTWLGGAGTSAGTGANWLGGVAPDAEQRSALFEGANAGPIVFGENEGVAGLSRMVFFGDGDWTLTQNGDFDLAIFSSSGNPGATDLQLYGGAEVELSGFNTDFGFTMSDATVGGGVGNSGLAFTNSTDWGGSYLYVGLFAGGEVTVDSTSEIGLFGTAVVGSGASGDGEIVVDGTLTFAVGDATFGTGGGFGLLEMRPGSTLVTGGEQIMVFGEELVGGLRGGSVARGEMHLDGVNWSVSDTFVYFGDGGHGMLRVGGGSEVVIDTIGGDLLFAHTSESSAELVIEEGSALRHELSFPMSFPYSLPLGGEVNVTVDGLLAADRGVTIGPGVLLEGDGIIQSGSFRGESVGTTNYGRFAPGRLNEIGTLTLNGDYSQQRLPGESFADSGSLYIDVSNSSSDSLHVNGAAFLSGGLFVEGTDDGKTLYNPTPGAGSERVLLEANAIFGQFSVAFLPGFDDARVAKLRILSFERGSEQVVYTVELLTETSELMGAQAFMTPGEPRDAKLADFDGDGDLDLALSLPDMASPESATGVVGIYENLGNDVMGDWLGFDVGGAQFVPVGVDPRGLAVADLDGNLSIDIAVVTNGDDSVWSLTNDGAGNFTADPPIVGFMLSPRDVAAGDFDGDGDEDLVVTGIIPATMDGGVGILDNTSSLRASFAAAGTVGFGDRPDDVDVDDVDNDKDLDLIVGDTAGEETGVIENITSAMGSPMFDTPVGLGIGAGQNAVLGVDLNLDLDSDLVTANVDGTISVLRGQGDGTYIPAVDYTVGLEALSVSEVDLNLDALPDLSVLARLNSGETAIVEMLNTTTPGSQTITFSVQSPTVVDPNATVIVGGDLNEDGAPDLVTANGGDVNGGDGDDVSVLLNSVEAVLEGDLNGSGKLDFGDLMVILAQYGQSGPGLAGDIDDDNSVGFSDLNALLTLFNLQSAPAG